MKRARGPLYVVHFKRRRKGLTNYKKRLALLKSGKTRMVVRKTNKYVIVQFINFSPEGDKTLVMNTSKDLNKYNFPGKCNTPSAYLTGLLAAKKAIKLGIKEFVLDIGLHSASKGSLLFSALKGAVDAGLKTDYSKEILPSEDRIKGKHLGEEIAEKLEETKKKILGE